MLKNKSHFIQLWVSGIFTAIKANFLRYFLKFSYNGGAYHGWQNQPNAITVQEVLENALSKLLRGQIAVVGAGRTDTGVHAKQMFAHFDVEGDLNTSELVFRLNSFLPSDIAVQDILRVNPDAHARFDAVQRTYEYWLIKEKDPFYHNSAHFISQSLNLEAMNTAALLIMDYKDFECFSKSHSDVKTFICDIKEAKWTIGKEKWVFTITADRFLRNMVRAIVGTLLDVGLGKIGPEGVRAIIEGKDRGKAGASVPAKGLYLTKVTYPDTIFE